MKRVGRLFDQITARENLREAVHHALRGKRHRPEAREWVAHVDRNLDRVAEQLGNGSFSFGRFHRFRIFDPKERLITAPCFEERVVHHAIMNVVEPYLERRLIDDTFACRKGKGRVKCLLRAKEFAESHAWFVKLDIRKYFDSISHDRLARLWNRCFKDQRLFGLLQSIVSCHCSQPGKGLPIGSLTSQHLANFYLSWLDRHAKETMRLRGYVRYMDDIAIWVPDGGAARLVAESVTAYLRDELDLVPKEAPYWNRTRHGMDFLGCRVFPSHLVPNRRSRVRSVRKWRALSRDLEEGRIGEEEFQRRATSLFSFLRTEGVSSWRFRTRILS